MKVLLLVLLLAVSWLRPDFKTEQLQHKRVQAAYLEKLPMLETQLRNRNIQLNGFQLYLQAFKQEQVLEVWGRNRTDIQFQLVQTIPFCATSGRLGPKSQEGDKQIPEGFYFIDRFHPESNFYLSLGLNYPNAADQIRSKAERLGGNIFIHGKCATIGCIPITDHGIKALYVLAVEAQQNGQTEIPVHIFPSRLTSYRLEKLSEFYEEKPELIAFWQNLKTGYDYFQKHKTVPQVEVNTEGIYVFR